MGRVTAMTNARGLLQCLLGLLFLAVLGLAFHAGWLKTPF
jgi:hypothetical protein